MSVLVELKHISKVYSKKRVLQDISLTIKQNQMIAIRGKNGSGKSTLLRIIAGLEHPNAGKVIYPNKNITIGYVPDRFPKQLRFTPSEYLNYIGKISTTSPDDLQNKISYFLHRFQLESLNNYWIRDLSKGNIQKVGIIQALLQKPDLLILDEPISGLDESTQQVLYEEVESLKNQKTTILMTNHESNYLDELVEQTYHVKDAILSKTNNKRKEMVKVLEITHIDKTIIEKWEEIINLEVKGDRLFLYVDVKHSDLVLAEILHLQGSVESVSTAEIVRRHDDTFLFEIKEENFRE